jgi:hypothetical protein
MRDVAGAGRRRERRNQKKSLDERTPAADVGPQQ